MKPIGASVLLAAGFFAVAALAGPPAPYPDFTFRTVKPPEPGTDRRITVQIAPRPAHAPEPSATARDRDTARSAGAGDYDWYWQAVSPALADSGRGRLGAALAALGKGPGVPAPRLQVMHELAMQHGRDILRATIGTRVSPALVLAVMSVESGGRATAVSPKGASGLMQLMPDTAARFGVSDVADPAESIRGGVAFLDWLMARFDRDPVLVLAAYNAGAGAVRDNAGVPPFAETRDYVPKVLAAWAVARGLCVTPPELISDGCVFRKGAAG